MLEYLFTKTPLLFLTQNLWRDEAFSYVLAARSIVDILNLTAGDFNPPLYYILLHFWMVLFGSSEIAMRGLSFLFFMGTVYILYDICIYALKLSHRRTIVYFLLFLCNPFLLTYAFEARMYMQVTFFVTLSYFALWTGRKKLYILAITLGLYSHYLSIFIYGAQILSSLFALWWKERNNSPLKKFFSYIKHQIRNTRYQIRDTKYEILYPLITPGLLFLPWGLFMLTAHDFSSGGGFWIITPPIMDFLYLPFVLYTSYERVFGQYYHERAGYTNFHILFNALLYAILASPLYIYIIKAMQRAESLRKQRITLLKILAQNQVLRDIILWAFFPPLAIFVFSFIGQSLYLPRYFIFSSTGLLLLLVLCFEYILRQQSKKMQYPVILAGIFGIFLVLFTNTFNELNLKYHSKRNVKSLYQEVLALKKNADLIYMDSELDYHLAQYYMGLDEKIYIYSKTYAGIPQYVGKVLIPAEVITTVLPAYPIRAFVVYYHWYNVRSLN